MMGWFTVPLSLGGIAWLANPLLILSWIFWWKGMRYAWIFALLASGLSLSFLAAKTIAGNEAGHLEKIIGVQGSYWLWVSACLVQLAGSLIFKPGIRKPTAD